MRSFSFRRGLQFQRGERVWSVVRRMTDGSIRLESQDGELWSAREADLLTLCGAGALTVVFESPQPEMPTRPVISRDLESYPALLQEKARRRMAYLERLGDLSDVVFTPAKIAPRIAEIAKEFGDTQPPSAASVYRWCRRLRQGGSITALVDRWEQRGRTRRWSDDAQRVVDEAIDIVLLHTQRHPRKAIVDYVKSHLASTTGVDREPGTTVRAPSRATLYRYMKRLEAYDIAAGRDGKRAADRRFRSVLGVQRAARIMERVEIDHTPLDLLIFCDKSRLPVGRPWISIAIDKFSRMVVGFYIAFHTPSAYSVLQCLRHTIRCKDDDLKRFPDITLPWPARGIPEVIVCDNGMDLHSDALKKVCQELNIQLQFCPARRPEYKGSVERFMRTINHDLIHRVPGTVFSNPAERGDYPSEKLACITFDTLVHLITKWIVEIYNQTPHRGLP